MTAYSSTYVGLEGDAPLPRARVLLGGQPTVSWPDQPQLTISLGQVDDPAAYLRGWAAELERLAEEVDAASALDAPVTFVPAGATS